MGKLRRLEIYTNTTLFTKEEKEKPSTPDEKLAASALLTLLSSPSPSTGARRREGFGGPALKRQKSDTSLQRRVTERSAAQAVTQPAPVAEGCENVGAAACASPDRNIAAVVAKAMGGAEADADKLAEAAKWLYRRVELVRGKYKGRTAIVVGMTAKKYRVRVEGVEHQLEFYPSMFKHPQPIPGAAMQCLQTANQESTGVLPAATRINQPVSLHTADKAVEREGSSSGSTGEPSERPQHEGSSHLPQAPQLPAGKTKEELLRLMDETSEEMRRARSMLTGYQEAHREIGASPRASAGTQPPKQHNWSQAVASVSTVPSTNAPVVPSNLCQASSKAEVAAGSFPMPLSSALRVGSDTSADNTDKAVQPAVTACTKMDCESVANVTVAEWPTDGVSHNSDETVPTVPTKMADSSLKLTTAMSNTHITQRTSDPPKGDATQDTVQQPNAVCFSA